MADSYVEFPGFLTGNQKPLRLKTLDNADGTFSFAFGGGASGVIAVQGNVAEGAASSGNPLFMGGVYRAAPSTVTDGQRTAILTDEFGQQKVVTMGTNTVGGPAADNAAASGNPVIMGLQYNSSVPTYDPGDAARLQGDVNGNLKVTEATLHAGEDLVNDTQKVEARFTPVRITADGVIKSGSGFVHTLTIAPTSSTPTAGLFTLYDNTAESGTVLYSEWITTTTPAHTVTLDITCATGLYGGYDGTLAGYQVTASIR